MKKIYLTTAIDYANGKPHLGHLYERLIADTLAKYLFLFSTSIRFLIGLDEHGSKSQGCAVLNNVKPKLLTHLLSLKFQSFFIKFGVLYSLFVRTSCKVHEKNNNYILKFF
jgi:methionyl-tRNA synthetase